MHNIIVRFEGIHKGHDYLKFEDLMKNIEKITSQQVGSDKLMTEIHIKETFKKIKESINTELDQY